MNLGIVPYYMFLARDTGAQSFFSVPLAEAHDIFADAIRSTSGLCRTVRGPSMSCTPGKVEILGLEEVNGEKAFVLRFVQCRDESWIGRIFFAKYDCHCPTAQCLGLWLPAAALAVPQATWPAAFEAWYASDYKHTTGLYATDSSKDVAASRIVLGDGSGDHLCSAFHTSTRCEQLTVGGFRYLYFPNVKDCCKCCTYTAGSYDCGGPVGPQWVNNATGNLQYLGREEILGRTCHKWSVEGVFPGHLNYYFEDVASGRPCGIDGYNFLRTPAEPADDQYLFEVEGLNLTVDPSTFHVPDMSRDSRYCAGKVCASGPNQATLVHL